MDIRKDKRGFSLIELIITMAIMAVFAGAIIGGMSYINAGKTKKAAARLNNKISSIQTATMTKKVRRSSTFIGLLMGYTVLR